MSKTKRIIRIIIYLTTAGLIMVGGFVLYVVHLYYVLPDPSVMQKANPQITAFIQRDCKKHPCQLNWTPLNEISPFVSEAILLSEDPRFMSHPGIDWKVVRYALLANLRHGKIVWGGSSITMQLAKNLYLAPEKTFARKLREILLTYKLEENLTKNRILEIYLNVAEWGPDVFGIGNASRYYFHRKPIDLGPLEASFLASILPNPKLVVDEKLPRRFIESGAKVFETLINFYIPSYGHAPVAECTVILTDEERGMLDYVVAKLFSHLVPEIRTGKASLYSIEDIKGLLNDSEWAFVEGLLERVGSTRKTTPLNCIRDFKEDQFAAFRQEDLLGKKRVFWVTRDSLDDLQGLLESAADQGLLFKLTSAYRADGYQVFTFLSQIRQFGYCFSDAVTRVALPGESEHACTDRQAIDFGDALSNQPFLATGDAFNWLKENASKYNFNLTNPEEDEREMIFEPWHWRHKNPDAKQ